MLLGDRVRELRSQRQETLKDIAQATSLSVSYLSDIERGKTYPSIPTLQKIAEHFDISVNDLIAGVEFAGEITEMALPPGFAEFISDPEYKSEIDEDWKELLLKIELRGKRPQSKREWMELYLNLRRVIQLPKD